MRLGLLSFGIGRCSNSSMHWHLLPRPCLHHSRHMDSMLLQLMWNTCQTHNLHMRRYRPTPCTCLLHTTCMCPHSPQSRRRYSSSSLQLCFSKVNWSLQDSPCMPNYQWLQMCLTTFHNHRTSIFWCLLWSILLDHNPHKYPHWSYPRRRKPCPPHNYCKMILFFQTLRHDTFRDHSPCRMPDLSHLDTCPSDTGCIHFGDPTCCTPQ